MLLATAFATALSAGSVVMGSSPALAGGNWFPQPCTTNVQTVCTSGSLDTSGNLITSTAGTGPNPGTPLKWNACDSVSYKSSSYDGIIWQNGPGGRTTCTPVRGSNG